MRTAVIPGLFIEEVGLSKASSLKDQEDRLGQCGSCVDGGQSQTVASVATAMNEWIESFCFTAGEIFEPESGAH